MPRATPEQLLTAAKRELALIHKRLITARITLYRETGSYPDDLGAAIARVDFLLRDLLAGLITPAEAKSEIDSVRRLQ